MTVIRVSSLLFTRHVQSVRRRQSRVKYVMQPKRTLEQLNAACSNLLTYAEPWHSWEILGKSQSHDFSEKKNGGGGIIDTTEAQMPEGVITATSSQPQPFTVDWRAEAQDLHTLNYLQSPSLTSRIQTPSPHTNLLESKRNITLFLSLQRLLPHPHSGHL